MTPSYSLPYSAEVPYLARFDFSFFFFFGGGIEQQIRMYL